MYLRVLGFNYRTFQHLFHRVIGSLALQSSCKISDLQFLHLSKEVSPPYVSSSYMNFVLPIPGDWKDFAGGGGCVRDLKFTGELMMNVSAAKGHCAGRRVGESLPSPCTQLSRLNQVA